MAEDPSRDDGTADAGTDGKRVRHPWKWATIGIVLLVLLAGGAYAFTQVPYLYEPSGEAPDFTIDTVWGDTFTLSEHRGEVVVIDLMAVDCPTCRITENAMLQVNQTRPNATLVSVDIWVNLETEERLRKHMIELGADWPAGMDTDGLLSKYDAFEISKVVVVDPEGTITWSKVGGVQGDELEAAIDEAAAGEGRAQRNLQLGLLGFAAVAGLASFFAPCAFPLLPGYMAYTVSLQSGKDKGREGQEEKEGETEGDRRKEAMKQGRVRDAILPGVVAAAGILIVYGLIGVVVALLGEAAAPWLPLLQPFVGVAAIVLGIVLLMGVSMDRIVQPLQRAVDRLGRKITGAERSGGLAGFFSYGLGYGAAAAGCTAPVFLQVSLSALAFGLVTGIQVFAVYAGMAALLMVVATLVSVKASRWLQRNAGRIVKAVNPVVGVIMIGAGAYLIWFYWQAFQQPLF